MKKGEAELFQILYEESLDLVKSLNHPRVSGMWKTVVELYAESAHFIYELIQNADDALAEKIQIVLCPDKLIFKHDGKKHFNITDDRDNACKPGDINSLVSVGRSNKTVNEEIGKFGLGFKSVYSYTNTPYVYDDSFHFKIEDKIVPVLIETDHPLREKGETLFELPFIEPVKASEEIKKRLQNLEKPVLFLPHVKSIKWKEEGDNDWQTYTKSIKETKEFGEIKCEKTRLNECGKTLNLYVFKKMCECLGNSYKISVGYFLDSKGNIDLERNKKIYCFFKTNEEFDGCFICHAPFLLTGARDRIQESKEENNIFLKGIAKLAADSLLCLRDIGLKNGRLLINQNIFNIIDVNEGISRNDDLRKEYFRVTKNEKLILGKSHHYYGVDNIRTTTEDLERLFTGKELSSLIGKTNMDFVEVTSDRNSIQTMANKLGILSFKNEDIALKLSSHFMDKMPKKWIDTFIEYIRSKASSLWENKKEQSYYSSEVDKRKLHFRYAPIAKTNKGEWVPPFNAITYEPKVVLPYSGFSDADSDTFGYVLDEKIYKNHQDFYERLGLKKPDEYDYLEKAILPKYNKNVEITFDEIRSDLYHIYTIYHESNKKGKLIDLLKKEYKLVYFQDGKYYLSDISSTYLDDEELVFYFGDKKDTKFVGIDIYKSDNYPLSEEEIRSFMKELGVNTSPIICFQIIERFSNLFPEKANQALKNVSLSLTYSTFYEDYKIDGYDINRVSEKWSHLLWKYLIKKYSGKNGCATLKYVRRKCSTWENVYYTSTLIENLRRDKWICDEFGHFYSPSEITLEEFVELGYERLDVLTNELNFCSDINKSKHNPDYENIQLKLKQEEEYNRRTEELRKQAIDKGIDINALLERAIHENGVSEMAVGHGGMELTNAEIDLNDFSFSLPDGIDLESPYYGYFKEHEADIIDYIDGLEKPTSKVRSTIQYIGRLIYEQYLIDHDIPYEKAEGGDSVYYDYKINGEEKYITIRTTEKSILDRNFDIGLRAAQNAFLKEHPNAQFRMVRISISDINVEPEYKDIIGFFGKDTDPSMDDRFLKKCEKLVKNYWNGATVAEFDEVSPEYLIKIEQKK